MDSKSHYMKLFRLLDHWIILTCCPVQFHGQDDPAPSHQAPPELDPHINRVIVFHERKATLSVELGFFGPVDLNELLGLDLEATLTTPRKVLYSPLGAVV